VQPDPDELFKRYNSELQQKALFRRKQQLKDHAIYVAKLREYSKSEKPLWITIAEEEKKQEIAAFSEHRRIREEIEKQNEEIMAEQQQSST